MQSRFGGPDTAQIRSPAFSVRYRTKIFPSSTRMLLKSPFSPVDQVNAMMLISSPGRQSRETAPQAIMSPLPLSASSAKVSSRAPLVALTIRTFSNGVMLPRSRSFPSIFRQSVSPGASPLMWALCIFDLTTSLSSIFETMNFAFPAGERGMSSTIWKSIRKSGQQFSRIFPARTSLCSSFHPSPGTIRKITPDLSLCSI